MSAWRRSFPLSPALSLSVREARYLNQRRTDCCVARVLIELNDRMQC